jgi:holliday junction DNA helicase RuvA
MIFQIKGKLISRNGLLIILDVSGIGYGLYASMNTLSRLPQIGEEVVLYTHLIIREDVHILYGFLEEKEKLLFCELIKISGFGPKLALSVLSHLSVEQFLSIVMLKETSKLVDLPGVGHKTAERLIVEIGNNINSKSFATLLSYNAKSDVVTDSGRGISGNIDNKTSINENIINDTQEALVALGYKPKQAIDAIKAIINNTKKSQINIVRFNSSEELLKAALRNLSKVYYD